MSVRLTRSQTGATPRKPENPGFTETPGTFRRTRKSLAPLTSDQSRSISPASTNGEANGHSNGKISPSPRDELTNGHANGETPKRGRGRPRKSVALTELESTSQSDALEHMDFGGSWGVSAMMIGFPILMWYMWIGATYYDGGIPTRSEGQSYVEFIKSLANLVYQGAYPHKKAWIMYWSFFIVEGLFYLYMPGIYVKGKPLPHLGGKQLDYYCSAMWSFYATIIIMVTLHITGLFPLYTIIDEFGPIMSVAIISGFGVSIVAYFSAWYRGVQHRMTGSLVYDFFMGAELNPRLLGWLDFKMFFEVRLPWFILFLLSLGSCARQIEQYGYLSGEMGFILMAHFLYANACAKGEECIVPTWDMYFEKWGFMLIFWNLAGVPLSYCHCTIYLANHDPAEYKWSKPALVALYISYLAVYWVWDTANSQKNLFRYREKGTVVQRKAFPVLPWREIENPETIKTTTGDSILVDGWFKYARKIHYTCDVYFAVTWGLITGFKSPFPWFYPVFFTCMIIHRNWRDGQKCAAKYGDAWVEYRRRVPWLFIPYVF
ncbi:ERG4/ERG24 ergosterol biosynthesis protein [Tothia fuscella]|uniref:Delta(24(24(1)))-sterol reductase n=1 Tax=Tothia fuscella TaxID=1048955 RepID=A0A9P4NXK6_9PEZI|nr:ERG4/ERG24 ergosterol biosynthesis protein [Tothia fuscella]